MDAHREAWTSTTPAHLAGRYWLGEPLGRGRSTVFRAIDIRLDRRVAVKQVELLAGQEDVERVRRRALREAKAAARLNNPRGDRVRRGRGGRVDLAGDGAGRRAQPGPGRGRRRADPALEGRPDRAGRSHRARGRPRRGVVHRDVKPANVMVQAGDRAKLTDFGVATIRDDSRLTATGLIVGSPSYMSPEQAQGAEVGPPTDLWSLGALLYFATEGEPPFHAGSALATASAVVHGEPRPVQHVGPLTEIIARLLTKDPDAASQRWPDPGRAVPVARGQRSRTRTARLPAGRAAAPGRPGGSRPCARGLPPGPDQPRQSRAGRGHGRGRVRCAPAGPRGAADRRSPGDAGRAGAVARAGDAARRTGRARADAAARRAADPAGAARARRSAVRAGTPARCAAGGAGAGRAADPAGAARARRSAIRAGAPARCAAGGAGAGRAAGGAGAGRAAGRPAARAVPPRARDRTRGAARRAPARPRGARQPARGAAQPGRAGGRPPRLQRRTGTPGPS